MGDSISEFEVVRGDPVPYIAVGKSPKAGGRTSRRDLALAILGCLAAAVVVMVSIKLVKTGWQYRGKGDVTLNDPVLVERAPPKPIRSQPQQQATPPRLIPQQPVEIISVDLSNLHSDGSSVEPASEEDVLDLRKSKFRHSNLRVLSARVQLKNNYHGIRDYSGKLDVKYIQPDRQIFRNSSSPPGYTLERSVSLMEDSPVVTVAFGWGANDASSFEDGQWSIELWWAGRKIGEKAFVVYSPPNEEGR